MSYLTTIINFLRLHRPVKSELRKLQHWPRYEAAKWGQVRFCMASIQFFQIKGYILFSFMANSELLSHLPIDSWRDFAILAFSFHKEVRFCKALAKSYRIVDNPYTQSTDNCSLRGKILEVFPVFLICGWDFQAETGLIRYTLTIALIWYNIPSW